LVYHRVNDELRDSVTVSIRQFKEQILFLKSHYEIFDLDELPNLQGKKLKRPMVAITFDDGYADNFEAARFLAENGVRAGFFISTRIVGSANPFPHDLKRLGKAIDSLSWEQVLHMTSWGHIIGSHTADHPNLSSLCVEKAIQQIAQGQHELVDKLGEAASPEFFAYPHGLKEDFPEDACSALPRLGIKYCFSAYGGINRRNFVSYDIRRQGIDHSFSEFAFHAAIEGWKVRVPKRK
jgi:peptidoglycan/xylan/chitin deacetylase (PgdA/CDA1 family)